ncbi:hypothetical protein NBRC116601_19790 [Cognatishimia sp. WU-CL00825]
MDMAKFVSLLMTHGGDLSDYYGEFKVRGPIIPVIAIPTTAGTGSEVTPVAVVADNMRDLKVGVSSPYMIPQVAICDPELTLTCPPGLTAVAGADALTHAIEAFTAKAMGASDTDTETLAKDAIRRIRDLFAEIRIPETLADLGLGQDKLDWVASQSMSAARLINNNPRKLELAGVTEIVTAAFHGTTNQEIENAV